MDEQTEKKPHLFEKGNQAARKHGYYSNVLDAEQQQDFEQAINVEGLDEEIALMRVKIKSLIQKDPDNLKLITQAFNALTKLIIAKYDVPKDDKKTFMEIVSNVLSHVIPAGFALSTFLKK